MSPAPLGLPFAVAAIFMLPLAVFASKGMAPLFAATALGTVIIHFHTRRTFPSISPLLGSALATFVTLAAISALWSVTPQRTLEATVPFSGLLLGFACMVGISHDLDNRQRDRIGRLLLVGVFAGLAFLLIESVFSRALLRWVSAMLGVAPNLDKFTLKPAATIAAILFWPTLVALHKFMPHPPKLWMSGGVFFLVIVSVGGDAAILGLALGLIVFLAGLRWRRNFGRILGALMAILIMAAPLIPPMLPNPQISMKGIEYLPNSAIHRVYIWQVTAKHIYQRPWLGHGFDTARSLYPQSTMVEIPLVKQSIGGLEAIKGEPIPLHPHNMILQIWLELGAAGAVLTIAVLLAFLRMLARAPLERFERAVGYGFLVTALTISAVAYGAWQAWWLSAMGLGSVLFVAIHSQNKIST